MGAAWARRGARERGAVAVVTALAITLVALPVAALSVDLGVQRVAAKDAQTIADSGALDASRALASNASLTSAQATTIAQATAANGSKVAGVSPTVSATVGTVTSTFVSNHSLGCGSSSTNAYFSPGGSAPNAVLVVVRSSVNRFFAKAIGAGSGSVCRSAIAKALPQSQCYSVSSFALGVDTNNSVLGPLLGLAGSSVALQAISSAGIASTNISLAAVAAQLSLGSAQGLVSSSSVTIGQFVLAAATVMTQNGNTASATALNSLYANLGPLASKPLSLGQIVNLGTGPTAATDANINLGQLLSGSLLVADGTNAISIPGLNITVPGLGTLSAKATVITPPVIGCNGAAAKSTQVSIELKQTGSGQLGYLLNTATNIDMFITLANATAASDTTVACSPASMVLKVSNQTLANIELKANIALLSLLGIQLSVASLDTGAGTNPVNQSYTLSLPTNYTTPLVTNSGSLGINLANASATVLGIISLNNLTTLMAPLVNQVSSLITGPLTQALGITVAGANLLAMNPSTCGGPQLAE